MVPAEILDWDTKFFGFRIGRVRHGVLTPTAADAIDEWCAREGVRCLYLLCRGDDLTTSRVAEAHGYHLADIRVTLRWAPEQDTGGQRGEVRPARPEDVPALVAIAQEAFRNTRFYNDPNFPRDRVKALYETWTRKSVEGWADAVLVAEDEAGPAGFITCHLQGSRIGLVGVEEQSRGGGVGQTLVRRAQDWFRERGAAEVLVATQGGNAAAQRLYQRCGFLTHAVELWYHKWRLI